MSKPFVAAAMFASLLAGVDAALALDHLAPSSSLTGLVGAMVAFTGFVFVQRAADRAQG